MIETVDETHVFCGCSSEEFEHSDNKSGFKVSPKAVYTLYLGTRDHLFVHVSVSAGSMVSASWFGLRVTRCSKFS